MALLLIRILGWSVARAPEPLLRVIASVLGDFIFFCLPRRRRIVLSNLHHAFPAKPAAWHRAIGRESCRRLVETGLLSLATPFLDEARCRKIISASPELLACCARHQADPKPTLICSPHLAYWEAQTAMALVVPAPFPEFGIIFRPLDNPAVNAFVKVSRERFGMKLLSRKEGFAEALKILRRQGFVGVLFDQNAGLQGALTTLFGRVCSTTELPGLMAEKFDARVFGIFPRRRGFWRIEISVDPIQGGGTSNGVTIALNRWLESLLERDDNLCASWLWAHDRWRHQDVPAQRLRLAAKRNLLAADLRARDLSDLPRRTRIWIRLPNWLGDIVMAVPLLRALRASRPDAEITLIANRRFLPLLQEWRLADRLEALPPRGWGYFTHFWRLRGEFPDVWLLFTNSIRGDLEGFFSRCRHRFGMTRPGRPRPLLTHHFSVPADGAEYGGHQLEEWERFLRHFGLAGPLDRTPISGSFIAHPRPAAVGLIPGSENMPAKRWPVSHWRALITSLPDQPFVLLGTAGDRPITTAIAEGFSTSQVENAAGATDLAEFARRVRNCPLLITNDTGGMHLANALGVPVIALFGPTNPVRTGPVFRSRTAESGPGGARAARPGFARILQPPGCPPTGGGDLGDLTPEVVIAHAREMLPAAAARV